MELRHHLLVGRMPAIRILLTYNGPKLHPPHLPLFAAAEQTEISEQVSLRFEIFTNQADEQSYLKEIAN